MDDTRSRVPVRPLTPEQRHCLRRRMQTHGPPSSSAACLAAPGRSLSPGQERLWFLDRLHPGLGLYNVPLVVRLEGELDVDALRRSILHEVIRRHEVLRTRIVVRDGRPVPCVDAAAAGLEFSARRRTAEARTPGPGDCSRRGSPRPST